MGVFVYGVGNRNKRLGEGSQSGALDCEKGSFMDSWLVVMNPAVSMDTDVDADTIIKKKYWFIIFKIFINSFVS